VRLRVVTWLDERIAAEDVVDLRAQLL